MNTNDPAVFISHASEDNKFVEKLASLLMENGINVWVDFWEILPGDKLIDKIFNTGIGSCKSFIIILSKTSVLKPWVKEELDLALIKRIEEQTKLIPIKIDDCIVPPTLKATVWLSIDVNSELDTQIQPLITSIHNQSIKNIIVNTPSRFIDPFIVEDYNIVESAIIRYLIKVYYDNGKRFITSDQIKANIGFEPLEINDGVEILSNDGIVKIERYSGTAPFNFGTCDITEYGFVLFANSVLDIDVNKDLEILLTYIVSTKGWITGEELHNSIQINKYSINKYIAHLETVGYIKVLKYAGTSPYTFGQVQSTAQGRRYSH